MISCSQIIASPPLFLLFCLILMTTFYLPSFFHVNIGVHLLKASLKHCVVGDNLKLVLLPLPSEGRDYRYAPTHSVHYILRAEPGSHACLASTLLSPALHPLLWGCKVWNVIWVQTWYFHRVQCLPPLPRSGFRTRSKCPSSLPNDLQWVGCLNLDLPWSLHLWKRVNNYKSPRDHCESGCQRV